MFERNDRYEASARRALTGAIGLALIGSLILALPAGSKAGSPGAGMEIAAVPVADR
ncbi:hypothetical protein [Sphingomicrobium sediminis]|uniref:Uncharacterized protein n=1 Tax=Sphingomicrobium sediminis TaxID=2950949 RepID=A0A9X2J581_9SPHN|nr:hypothetical protein [Sphingomicrobium sediminis]MCM8557982.1 hypothetical protein [Sphingomicrobium sediminis]